MRDAGYDVGVFGKVTNDQSTILPAASEQQSMGYIDSPLDYNDYDGLRYFQKLDPASTKTGIEKLDAKDPRFETVYQTTQIGNRTLAWLRGRRLAAAGGKKKPFFAYIGPHAPHFPAQPAPWYEHAFDATVTAPRTPNYNISQPDKPQHIRQNPPLDARAKCWEDQHFRDRWASLLSVDDLLRDVIADLEGAGELDSTVFVYSSDHGYKQGQWRVGTSKQHPYETDISVPIIFAGAGIKRNATVAGTFPVGNVDIAPTLLELAGAAGVGPAMDGKSLVPHILADALLPAPERAARTAGWRDAWLVEYLSVGTYWNDHSAAWQDGTEVTERCGGVMPRMPGQGPGKPEGKCVEGDGVGTGKCWFVDSEHSNSYRGLRLFGEYGDALYVEYDPTWAFNGTAQFYEYYDLAKDPYQMDNTYADLDAATRAQFHGKLAAFFACSGASCP
jgi:N-acetylglucosamine-6-sulfatase